MSEGTTLPPILEDKKPGKKGRPKGSKTKAKLSFTPKEIGEKLHIIFRGISGILGYEYTYKPEDFDQESKAIVRLSEKFPPVGQILTLFDPVLIVLGIAGKFKGMKKKPKVKTEAKQTESGTLYPIPNRKEGEA